MSFLKKEVQQTHLTKKGIQPFSRCDTCLTSVEVKWKNPRDTEQV